MKTIRTIVLFIAIAMTLIGSAFAFNVEATYVPSDPETSAVEPRAEEVRWYYRIVDGVKQMRLWSITYGKWLTDWINVE